VTPFRCPPPPPPPLPFVLEGRRRVSSTVGPPSGCDRRASGGVNTTYTSDTDAGSYWEHVSRVPPPAQQQQQPALLLAGAAGARGAGPAREGGRGAPLVPGAPWVPDSRCPRQSCSRWQRRPRRCLRRPPPGCGVWRRGWGRERRHPSPEAHAPAFRRMAPRERAGGAPTSVASDAAQEGHAARLRMLIQKAAGGADDVTPRTGAGETLPPPHARLRPLCGPSLLPPAPAPRPWRPRSAASRGRWRRYWGSGPFGPTLTPQAWTERSDNAACQFRGGSGGEGQRGRRGSKRGSAGGLGLGRETVFTGGLGPGRSPWQQQRQRRHPPWGPALAPLGRSASFTRAVRSAVPAACGLWGPRTQLAGPGVASTSPCSTTRAT